MAAAVPRIMGILNVTPDSFSDGGRHSDPVAAGLALLEAGADIIDVGGESTRPGAAPVPLEEELRRTIPVVSALSKAGVAVSIDTMKAEVMRQALAEGAVMLNDVTALSGDRESLSVAAAAGADVVLMHMPGNPRTMQGLAGYADPAAEVIAALHRRIMMAETAGIERGRIIADPGIGFGKALAHNLDILRRLEAFRVLGVPLLLGASRKSLIPGVAGPAPVGDRLPGSLAIALRGAEAGVAWLRVHDVAETRQALALWAAMRP